MVRALALRSGYPGFKTRCDHSFRNFKKVLSRQLKVKLISGVVQNILDLEALKCDFQLSGHQIEYKR